MTAMLVAITPAIDVTRNQRIPTFYRLIEWSTGEDFRVRGADTGEYNVNLVNGDRPFPPCLRRRCHDAHALPTSNEPIAGEIGTQG